MEKTEAKEQIEKTLLEKAKSLPPGTAISTAQLYNLVYPNEQSDSKDLFQLHFELEARSKEVGLFFDSSAHWNLCEGLPYNLDFVIRPRKRNISFDKIRYCESAYPGPDKILLIDFCDKSICYYEKEYGKHYVPEPYKCSREQWYDIVDLIKDCNFAQWEHEYANNYILDGMQWEIELIKNERTRKKIYGSNEFPVAWRIFWALKQTCIRLMKREVVCFSKPEKCPFCGSKKIKSYFYGLPTAEIANSGKYIIGGCCIMEGKPKWGCEDCGANFIEGNPAFDNLWTENE